MDGGKPQRVMLQHFQTSPDRFQQGDFPLEGELVIEVDGGQHTKLESYDAARTAWLEGEGFRVIRFWNNQVLTDTDSVQDAIWMAVKDLLPSPFEGEG